MKQKKRLGDSYALLYRLSAYWRNQLSEIFRKHKRKPSSRRRFHTKPRGGDPSSKVHKRVSFAYNCLSKASWNLRFHRLLRKSMTQQVSCVQTPAKAPALPRLGLATGLTVMLLITMCICAHAQEGFTVTGKVISIASSQPIEGATVTNKRTRIHAITDRLGEYRILARPDDVLIYSFVGYMTAEEEINGREQIIVALDSVENALDEVVIIGYGQTSKRFNTGSVSTVSAKEIEQQPVTNVLSALSGRMAGVFVQTTNGLPGGNINIQIRGRGSIAAGNNPLYIIDGVPFDGRPINAETVFASDNIVGSINPLNSLNPSDIESITVLKDADATAIYGSRGTNGVVLITTKNYQRKSLSLDINYLQGMHQAANLPNVMDVQQYLEIRRQAFENDNRIPSADLNSRDYAPDLMVWDTTKANNWPQYFFGNTGQVANFQGSITGGVSNTFFNLSGNYRRETTILPSDDNRYGRGGWHATVNHESANSKFKMSLNNSYTLDNNTLSNPANSLAAMMLLPPHFPIYNDDGNFNWFSNNPIASGQATSRTKTSNLLNNIQLNYNVFEELQLKLSVGYNKMNTDQTQIFPLTALFPGSYNYTLFGISQSESAIVEPQANYTKQFNNSHLNVLIGGTYQSMVNSGQYIKATHFSNETLMENLSSAGNIEFRTNSRTQYKYASMFGRLTYNLFDTYVINATFRRDGSSRFGPGNQFGNFGALGAAWIFSESRLFKTHLSFFSFGKLRASYGTTGNDQIPDYQYLSTYGNSPYVYNGVATLSPIRVANDQFHWETTKKFEVGLELGLAQNRLLLSTNYYLTRSDDQLVGYSVPRMTGFSSYQANLPAMVENRGFEVELDASVIERPNFNWRLSFNVTMPRNVLKSFQDFENSSYTNTLEIGYDINRIYGFKLLEINPETGRAEYADRDGIASSTPFNFHTLSRSTPDYFGGIGNNINIHNWDISVFGNFVKQTGMGGVMFPPGGLRNNYAAIWHGLANPTDDKKFPIPTLVNDSRYRNSSANIYDTSFFRITNINISYSIPTTVISKYNVQRFRLYGQIQNLLTFYDTNAPIIDPESGAMGTGSAPPIKSYNLGIQVTF